MLHSQGVLLPSLFYSATALQKFQRDLELALLVIDCIVLKFPELLEWNSTAVEFSTATTKLQVWKVKTSCDLDPER